MSMYQLNGARYSPRPQQSACTYNGVARPTPTRISTTDATGGNTEYTSTGPTYYGPITTGTTIFPVTTTDSAGLTTIYETTRPLCEGGNCEANQHTPGGSITTTHMPTYTQPLATPLTVSDCTWQGCYDAIGNRALEQTNNDLDRNAMSIELCVGTCLSRGFAYAGVEYGSECYCDSLIRPPHQLVYGNTSTQNIVVTCANPEFACRGDRTQMCGGYAAIGIYYCPANAATTTFTT